MRFCIFAALLALRLPCAVGDAKIAQWPDPLTRIAEQSFTQPFGAVNRRPFA
jgi:hypothetical protein